MDRQIGEGNPATDRCRRCGWIDELLDDDGGKDTTDRHAFEAGMEAAVPVPDRLEAAVRGPATELNGGGRRDVDAGGETEVREPYDELR